MGNLVMEIQAVGVVISSAATDDRLARREARKYNALPETPSPSLAA